MKKFLAILVAAVVATTACACIFASAEMGPIGDDLLAESGLGDFAYIEEEGIALNTGTWVGHESWNTNEGWDGFRGNDENPTMRSIVDDDVKGKILRIEGPAATNGGSETAIENIDKICGFEAGKSYVAVIEYRTTQAWCNGHELCFDWGKDCTHGDQETFSDGKWHTIVTPVLKYKEDMVGGEGYGHYLYMACCENWWSEGDWLEIASVEVYEYGEQPATGDAMIVAVIAFTVALAATVVFTKKKAY